MAALCLVVAAGAACSDGEAGPTSSDVVATTGSSPTTTTSPPDATTTTTPDEPSPGDAGAVLDWVDSEQQIALDGGWVVSACVGDAPLICIERNGETVGALEAAAYAVDSLSYWDAAAHAQANLEALAAAYYQVFDEDRAAGCGVDYGYEPFATQPFVLGGLPGLHYGFAGTMPDGSSSELHLQYATVVGDRVIAVVASAYDEGGCPGPDGIIHTFDSTTLAEFRPHLEALLHDSPLPELDTPAA